MPAINTSRCSNVEELTNRLVTFSGNLENEQNSKISKFINGLIANFSYYILSRPTQSEQVYKLLNNNQELLSNALHKRVDQEDKVFGVLEKLRDTLSNESCETRQVSKIAEGIFSTLQKTNSILPNDRQSALNYEVQLCQILNADVTDKKLMSQISKFATDLGLARFKPLSYIDYLKTLPLKERVRCFELSCWMMSNGYLMRDALPDMALLMRCKPEVLNKARLCCEVINRKKFDMHFVEAFKEIPEDDQDIAIHFISRLSHHLSKDDSGAQVLKVLAKGFKELSISEIDEVVDLTYEQSAFNDVGDFIEGLLAIDKEDRPVVFKLIKDRIAKRQVGATIVALGEIKDINERKQIWNQVKDSWYSDAEVVAFIKYESVVASLPLEERGVFIDQMDRMRNRLFSTTRLTLAESFVKFDRKEREQVTGLIGIMGMGNASFAFLEMFSKISTKERQKLLAKANDISALVDELNTSPVPNSTRERADSALTWSLGLSFVEGVFNFELLQSLMKLSQSKSLFNGITEVLQHIAPDERHEFFKKYEELLTKHVVNPALTIPMHDELLTLLQLHNEDQEFVTRICQDPNVRTAFPYLPILSKATSQGRKDLKTELPALLQAIPVLMLENDQSDLVWRTTLELSLTESGAFNVQVATHLLSLVRRGFSPFCKITSHLKFIGLDRRVEFINRFQEPLQNGRWTPEQRIEMHGFLLSELHRNITNQEYVKGFCEWIKNERGSLEIDEESLLFQEVVRLISILEGASAKNPYSIFQGHKKAEAEDPLLDLKMPGYTMTFGGVAKSYSFNLTKVRDTAKTASYLAKDIPEEFQPRRLKRLFSELRKRIQELPEVEQVRAEREITVLYSETSQDKKTFREMESNLLDKPFMIEMMRERLPDEKVSFYYYKLACIVKSILLDDNQVLEGKVFSAQELRLLDTAHAMSKCITGQKDGVDLVYNDFDRKDRYLDEKDLSKGTASESAFEDIIREEIQKGLSDALKQPAWMKVLGKTVSQESHQTEYMSNRVGKQIGLNWQLTFDEHTHVLDDGLIAASTQTLAEAVYETFPFDRFVTRVKDNINKTMEAFKGTPPEKYKEWKKLIDRVPKFNECFDVTEDDDGDAVINGINERGVVEIVKSMGYLANLPVSK